MCVSSYNFVGLTEKCDKKFNVLEFERKKIEEITNKHQQPDSRHTIHQPNVYVWTKFQLCVPEKREMRFFDIWKLERKMKKLREEQVGGIWFSFT